MRRGAVGRALLVAPVGFLLWSSVATVSAPLALADTLPVMLRRDVIPQGTYGGTTTLATAQMTQGLSADVYIALDVGDGHTATVGWYCGTGWLTQATVTQSGGELYVYPNTVNAALTGIVRYMAPVTCSFSVTASGSWSVIGASWVEVWSYPIPNPGETLNPSNGPQPITTPVPVPSDQPTAPPGYCIITLASPPPGYYGPGAPVYGPCQGPSYTVGPTSDRGGNVSVTTLNTGDVLTIGDLSWGPETGTFGPGDTREGFINVLSDYGGGGFLSADPRGTVVMTGGCVGEDGAVGDSYTLSPTSAIRGSCFSGFVFQASTDGVVVSIHAGWNPSNGLNNYWTAGAHISVVRSGETPEPSSSAEYCTFATGPFDYYIAPCSSGEGGVPIGWTPTGPGLGTGGGGGAVSCTQPGAGDLNPLDYFGWIGCSVVALPGVLLGLVAGAVVPCGHSGSGLCYEMGQLVTTMKGKAPFGYGSQALDALGGAFGSGSHGSALALNMSIPVWQPGGKSFTGSEETLVLPEGITAARPVLVGLVTVLFLLALLKVALRAVGYGSGGDDG